MQNTLQSVFRNCPAVIFLLFSLTIAPPLFAITGDNIQIALVEQLGYRPSEPFRIETGGIPPDVTDPLIANVYSENGFDTLWVDIDGPNANARILFDVLKGASEDGLDPEDYQVARIESYWHDTSPVALATLDILLTKSLHAYVSDAREGRIDPCLKDPDLFTCARDRSIDPVDLIAQALAAPALKDFLKNQLPDTVQYQELRSILKRYRDIEKNGGWPSIPEGPALKPSMHDPRIPLVRQRLAITEPLEPDAFADPSLYDETLAAAVTQFQARHGLEMDGVIGEVTRSAMNTTVASKIRQIVVNMERLRWISRDLGELYVMVNIAGFRLSVFDHTTPSLEMPVIVGKYYRKTPVFSDHIKYIEFNPYWNVPPSIAKKDILPKLKKDTAYLSEMKIHLFEGWKADSKELNPDDIQWDNITPSQMAGYKLRQDPGPKNLLGRVKFMFPNRFSVYLHGTPSQDLFLRTERTFSSGCIRLSQPVELASYLLGGQENGWDTTKIQAVIDGSEQTIITLKTPIPVHIVYLTVCIGPDGAVYFNKDVYGRDELLEIALFEKESSD